MSDYLKNFWKRGFEERILIAAIVLSLLAVIFPPFVFEVELVSGGSKGIYEGHAFIMSKPDTGITGPFTGTSKCYSCKISPKYLGIELGVIWLTALLVLSFSHLTKGRSLKERILIVAIVLSLLAIIYPPYERSIQKDYIKVTGRYETHGLLFSTPKKPSYCRYQCTISIKYLGAELAVIWLVAGLVYLITNKSGKKD